MIGLSIAAFIATCTAAGTYAYPETLAAIRAPMVLIHELSGDVAVALTVLYLVNHLARTWRMKKALVSRWTGIALVALAVVSALTGLYGQFVSLEQGSLLWWLHFVSSVVIILGACFHGLWAYRPRRDLGETSSV